MALEGLIEEFHLSELIQVLANGGKTCLINLKTPYGEGMIYLREGKLTHATDGLLEGEEAFYNFLWWKSGAFAMIPDEYPEKTSIKTGTHALIIEGNRILDEWTALRSEMPDLDYDSVISLSSKLPVNTLSKLPPQGINIIKALAQPTAFRTLIKSSGLQELELGRLINTLQRQGLVNLHHQTYSPLSMAFKNMADALFEEFAYNGTLMQLKAFESHLSEFIHQNRWPFEFKNYKVILSKTRVNEDRLVQMYTSFIKEEMNFLENLSSKELLPEILKKVQNRLSEKDIQQLQKLSIRF